MHISRAFFKRTKIPEVFSNFLSRNKGKLRKTTLHLTNAPFDEFSTATAVSKIFWMKFRYFRKRRISIDHRKKTIYFCSPSSIYRSYTKRTFSITQISSPAITQLIENQHSFSCSKSSKPPSTILVPKKAPSGTL